MNFVLMYCFHFLQGNNENSVSEDTFYQWLQKEPQTLVWLPTFHRVATTESGI